MQLSRNVTADDGRKDRKNVFVLYLTARFITRLMVSNATFIPYRSVLNSVLQTLTCPKRLWMPALLLAAGLLGETAFAITTFRELVVSCVIVFTKQTKSVPQSCRFFKPRRSVNTKHAF